MKKLLVMLGIILLVVGGYRVYASEGPQVGGSAYDDYGIEEVEDNESYDEVREEKASRWGWMRGKHCGKGGHMKAHHKQMRGYQEGFKGHHGR